MSLLDPRINFGKVTVSTGYDSTSANIILIASDGAKLPSTFSYNVVWWNFTDYPDPSDDPNVEIVRVTNKVSDTLTVTRAQESTSASTKNTVGKTYKMVLAATKKMIDDIESDFGTVNAIQLESKTWEAPGTIGSSTPNTGHFSTLAVDSSGQVVNLNASLLDNSNWSAPPPIGSGTPNTGYFTTLTVDTSSVFTGATVLNGLSGNPIHGTDSSSNAAAGYVGEFISGERLSANAITLANNVAADVTNIVLTKGDWDVCGSIAFTPPGNTTITVLVAAVSTTSATLPVTKNELTLVTPSQTPVNSTGNLPTPMVRILINNTTTVYLVARVSAGANTVTAYGFIRARRMR